MDKVDSLIREERRRQNEGMMLIPSENYASSAVRRAVGSVLMHKYAEGYPRKRYYQGNEFVDQIEALAIEHAKKLFKVPHANVQPYSGSIANAAVLLALLDPGDKIMGLKLSSGGHLTHGQPDITFSGRFYKSIPYDVDDEGKIDYESLAKLVKKEKPRLIFAGTTAYPFKLDFKKFGEIAESVGAWLVADVSHIAGLVVGGVHQSPAAHAHVITTTTHKTLRGPRGAIIMTTQNGLKKDPELASKIDRAVFPGIQGGPHENVIAGIAVALGQAAKPEFKDYAKQVVENSKALAQSLRDLGIKVIGSQNHLMLLDFSDFGGGAQMAYGLEKAGIYVNKNTIPHDFGSPFYPSGVRIGTPAVTTRGMKEKEMEQIAGWIYLVYKQVNDWQLPEKQEERSEFMKEFREWADKNKEFKRIRLEVKRFCRGISSVLMY